LQIAKSRSCLSFLAVIGIRQPVGEQGPSNPWEDAAMVAGLLLAAGAGRRYGMPKALVDGGAWVRRAVATLTDGLAWSSWSAARRRGCKPRWCTWSICPT
jgi:hypothetical protein